MDFSKIGWNRMPSRKKMRKDEMWELLDVIRTHQPEDQEYQDAFEAYKQFHELEIEESKLKCFVFGRAADILGFAGVVGIVLTQEIWTPVASSFGARLVHPFNHNDNSFINF